MLSLYKVHIHLLYCLGKEGIGHLELWAVGNIRELDMGLDHTGKASIYILPNLSEVMEAWASHT